jgi:hypothetical protein
MFLSRRNREMSALKLCITTSVTGFGQLRTNYCTIQSREIGLAGSCRLQHDLDEKAKLVWNALCSLRL